MYIRIHRVYVCMAMYITITIRILYNSFHSYTPVADKNDQTSDFFAPLKPSCGKSTISNYNFITMINKSIRLKVFSPLRVQIVFLSYAKSHWATVSQNPAMLFTFDDLMKLGSTRVIIISTVIWKVSLGFSLLGRYGWP